MIIKRIRSLFNPEQYHGWGRKRKYFEGWYFKVVDKDENNAFAFIPGISMNPDGERHSFIQVLDGKKRSSVYHRFGYNDFKTTSGEFEMEVSGNYFSNNRIELNLPGLTGRLDFSDQARWPNRWYSPGIMGPYAFVPFMECYHGILSLDHRISGNLIINGEKVDFTGGRGYTEKDWGHSFPSAYIWMQTNHFSRENISLKMSVAKIPWLGSSFVGFIAGVLIDGRLYQFTTYNGSKILKTAVDKEHVQVILGNRHYRLEISAVRSGSTKLSSPIEGFMGGHIFESLEAEVEVTLTDIRNGRIILNDKGKNAGLEVAGEVDELIV